MDLCLLFIHAQRSDTYVDGIIFTEITTETEGNVIAFF
jgi:hypothetical protein